MFGWVDYVVFFTINLFNCLLFVIRIDLCFYRVIATITDCQRGSLMTKLWHFANETLFSFSEWLLRRSFQSHKDVLCLRQAFVELNCWFSKVLAHWRMANVVDHTPTTAESTTNLLGSPIKSDPHFQSVDYSSIKCKVMKHNDHQITQPLCSIQPPFMEVHSS